VQRRLAYWCCAALRCCSTPNHFPPKKNKKIKKIKKLGIELVKYSGFKKKFKKVINSACAAMVAALSGYKKQTLKL